jgi:hypothetical protein
LMRQLSKIVFFSAVFALVLGIVSADAAKRKKQKKVVRGYPYSIMNDEPGMRSASPRQPWLANPHQSPLTPLGRVPQGGTVRPLGQAPSPPMVVPGVTGTAGPAITPARPAGQSFQDRTINCVHAGGSSGVGAGQIGAFTRSCVN